MILVAFAGAACVSVHVDRIDQSAPAANRSVVSGKGFGVTSSDDGGTVAIPGDTDLVRLALEDEYDWQVHVDPAFLRLEQSGPVQGQGFTARLWLFRLLRLGETDITADGSCKVSCVTPSRHLIVHLRIP